MYLIALIFTIAGWLFQFYRTVIRKDRSISTVLPLAYAIACILFGINSFIIGDTLEGILDVICAVLAAVIFIVLLKRKKAG
jgi:hypothetical protein